MKRLSDEGKINLVIEMGEALERKLSEDVKLSPFISMEKGFLLELAKQIRRMRGLNPKPDSKMTKKQFIQKFLYMGGCNSPQPVYSDEGYCVDCDVEGEVIKKEEESNRIVTDRGPRLDSWDVINLKCPKCKKTGKIEGCVSEKDLTFTSMSQPDG